MFRRVWATLKNWWRKYNRETDVIEDWLGMPIGKREDERPDR